MSTELSTIAPLKIVSNTTIYVRQGGNDNRNLIMAQTNDDAHALATIDGALNVLNQYVIARGATVTVQLSSGTFPMTGRVFLDHPNGKRIIIKGVSSAANSDTITSANTTTLDWTGVQDHGLCVSENSAITIDNLYIKGGTSGAKNTCYGAMVMNGGFLSCNTGKVRFEYWQFGVYLQNGANLTANAAASCGNSSAGFLINYGSMGDLVGAFARNNSYGFYSSHGSSVMVYNAISTGNSSYGCYCAYGSMMYAVGATCNSNGTNFSPAVNNVGNGNSIIVS